LEHKLATTPEAMKQVFGSMPRCRIAMETGTHSPWVSRLLTALGHEVIVGHAQKVRLITKSRRKDDRLDARTLARLGRIDPELLSPVKHRSAQAQLHLTEIRARAVLVSARTALVNAARGLVKSYGERLRKCGTEQFRRETTSGLSAGLREALEPLLREVESLNERIQEYGRRIEKMAKETYPETALLARFGTSAGGSEERSVTGETSTRQISLAAWSSAADGREALDAELPGVGETRSALRADGPGNHLAGLPV